MSIWDIVQQVQIENLKSRQRSGESIADSVLERSRDRDAKLDDKIERLALVTEAMWELLSEQTNVTVADLAARIRELDAKDGKMDGRRGPPPDAPKVYCTACQAVVPHGRKDCQFCGAPAPGGETNPFRAA
ncbi:MAG TPA: hypothetical protein VJY35_06220 [Candidatus Eisenbacteria bacterium]|nr:hypothetical protein [Candidatus Eisenbacteria bacterium]